MVIKHSIDTSNVISIDELRQKDAKFIINFATAGHRTDFEGTFSEYLKEYSMVPTIFHIFECVELKKYNLIW